MVLSAGQLMNGQTKDKIMNNTLKMNEVEEAARAYMGGVFHGSPMPALTELVMQSSERVQTAFWKIVDAEAEKQNMAYHISTGVYVKFGA